MPSQLRRAKRRNYKRPLFEELPYLDARWLARHRMIPKDWSRRVYPDFGWVNPAFPALVITTSMIEVYFSDGRRQQIVPIYWHPINGMCQGAIRPIFGCPRCRRHAFKLYDLYGELNCYKCAVSRGVIYGCQRQSAKGRAALQALRPAPLPQWLVKPAAHKNTVHAQANVSPAYQPTAPARSQEKPQ
jgi:hypothetical protein